MELASLLTFSNFLFVLSIGMIISAVIWLFGIYFMTIIILMPIQLIELILYTGLITLVTYSPTIFGDMAYVWAMLFTCGITATTVLTGYRTKLDSPTLFNFANMCIHGVVALYTKSSMTGFLSVCLLMALIGFQFGFGPGYVALGYSEPSVIPSATLASFIVMCGGAFVKINNIGGPIRLFMPGALWLGPLVYNLSMLILSSKYYNGVGDSAIGNSSKFGIYINMNILTIMSTLTSVFIGNMYDVSQLYGFAGTFMALFFLQKYGELMPHTVAAYAWGTLIIGILLYASNIYMRTEMMAGLAKYFNLLPAIPDV